MVNRTEPLLRHRAGPGRRGTWQQSRIHAVVAGSGYDRVGSYLSWPGRGWLAGPSPVHREQSRVKPPIQETT